MSLKKIIWFIVKLPFKVLKAVDNKLILPERIKKYLEMSE